jgi:hypothetical protein
VTEPDDRSIVDVVRTSAADLEAVEAVEDVAGSTWEWRIGGRPFARASESTVEFRLDPEVARAALRTPDTERSSLGEGWVAFRPRVVDRHAVDRAEAWLRSAWRLADGEG